MINLKYCKICRKAFDIGTNYEICPECRRLKFGGKDGIVRRRISNSISVVLSTPSFRNSSSDNTIFPPKF